MSKQNQISTGRFRKVIAVFVLAVVSLPLAAGEPGLLPTLNEELPYISSDDLTALMSEGQVLRFHGDGVSPVMLPETSLTSDVIRQLVEGDLNIGIEGLFFTPSEDMPAGYASMGADEKSLVLYNILRSVSTLQGLEYFSASRGEMRLLFEESWAVADGESDDPLPDPLVAAIPEEDVFLVHQKDKSFGTNLQEMTFRARPDVFAVSIVNQTPMRYHGLIKVVDPGNMQSHLIVVPVEEGLLIYGTMSARTREVKAFMDRARNSFTNRVIALTDWYRLRISEEF